ncbi:MAG TPA: alpha/beta fold hydrolase [Jiangellaceae bacterium]|nr:alpha/beta fold hydrolase [Jiangellaceae bacterium]
MGGRDVSTGTTHAITTADGIRLAYRVEGNPEAPPVVLLHGLGDDASSWDDVAPALADRHRVYVPEMRGHGGSDWPGSYSLTLMRDDVVGLLSVLGLERVDIVGHSMGGIIGYLLAAERPDLVGRLVLEEAPAPVAADPPRELPEEQPADAGFDWMAVAALYDERNHPDPSWWNLFARISAPTLVIAGGPSSLLPQDALAEMAARIPDARLVTIPGGHLVHEQCPDEFVAEVHTFLEVWVTGMPDDGVVTAVSRSATHTFSKRNQQRIRLLIAQGVEGDAHRGATVKHRSRVRRGATTPNLRQVHLIHAELHDDLGAVGFAVGAGDLGENVTTRGIDLLGLPIGTRLHLGDVAVVEVTGLRNPCSQIDDFQRGLLKEVVGRDETGGIVFKAGVMGVVLTGGDVRPGDPIRVVLPRRPHRPLERV